MFFDAIKLDQCGVGWCYFLGYRELFWGSLWTGPLIEKTTTTKKSAVYKKKRAYLIELKYYA